MSLRWVRPHSGVPGSRDGGDGSDDEGGGLSAAVLHGPMARQVINQLIRYTNWGDLDVLVLALPPSTGNVQLEVYHGLLLAGMVAVSTRASSRRWTSRRGCA
ncbi:hypothetical protein ACHAWF_005933 [Thalassiosira exigua]